MTEADDIEADVRNAILGASEEAAPALVEEVVAPVDAPAEVETEQGRSRDENGRFAKPAEKAQSIETPETPAPQEETSRPPHTLKATLKALWAALPKDIQEEFQRVEREAQNAKSEWQGKGERLNRYDALFADRREKLQLAGIDEFKAIEQLLAAQSFLERDPQQALAYLAQQYGVSLGAGPSQAQQPNPQPTQTPDIQQLIAQSVQAELNRANEQSERAKAVEAWESFRNDPAHPYAENVKESMAAMLTSGQAKDYQSAYDMACWANPEIRSLMQTQVAKPQGQQPTHRAGLSVTGARGTVANAAGLVTPTSSIEDDIRAAIQAASGRV